MGINRNFPTRFRYGNHNYGSLNLLHIKIEQLIKKITTINLLLNDSIKKSLILIVIGNYQLNFGLCETILQYPNINTKYINIVWKSILVDNINKYKISLQV